MLSKLESLLPTHTRRSEESQALQQFSTPVTLGHVAGIAAELDNRDIVLEPSAGTGLLSIFAELAGARLLLNELGHTRADLLAHLFPAASVTRLDAAQIHDRLETGLQPSVVLINPPFSASAHVEGRVADATYRHLSSALSCLAPGGRMVAITGASFSPENPAWAAAFARLQERGKIVFSAAVDGRVYARHGTTTDTRITVIDRVPAEEPSRLPPSHGMATDPATLLSWVQAALPPRRKLSTSDRSTVATSRVSRPFVRPIRVSPTSQLAPMADDAVELVFGPRRPAQRTRAGSARLYTSGSNCNRSVSPGAQPHPTPLVQSAAMASVRPPLPCYRPHMPSGLVEAGLLSDAQLETVILAGEAHSVPLAGSWVVDQTYDLVSAAPDGAETAVRFRRGFFLGDGTGAGKGAKLPASCSTIG